MARGWDGSFGGLGEHHFLIDFFALEESIGLATIFVYVWVKGRRTW